MVVSKKVLQIHTVMHLNGERLQLMRDFGTLEEARKEMGLLFDQLSTVENCLGEISRPSRLRRLLGRLL